MSYLLLTAGCLTLGVLVGYGLGRTWANDDAYHAGRADGFDARARREHPSWRDPGYRGSVSTAALAASFIFLALLYLTYRFGGSASRTTAPCSSCMMSIEKRATLSSSSVLSDV